MRLPVSKVVDLDEYKVIIEYDGKGGLDITVLDELEDEVEGIYISDSPDSDNTSGDNGGLDINMN